MRRAMIPGGVLQVGAALGGRQLPRQLTSTRLSLPGTSPICGNGDGQGPLDRAVKVAEGRVASVLSVRLAQRPQALFGHSKRCGVRSWGATPLRVPRSLQSRSSSYLKLGRGGCSLAPGVRKALATMSSQMEGPTQCFKLRPESREILASDRRKRVSRPSCVLELHGIWRASLIAVDGLRKGQGVAEPRRPVFLPLPIGCSVQHCRPLQALVRWSWAKRVLGQTKLPMATRGRQSM